MERIVLGATHIEVASQDFSAGYQAGYLVFTTAYQSKLLTDRDVYHFMACHVSSVQTTDHYNSGYIMSWCAALHGQGQPCLMAGYYADAHQEVQVTA
jgi:hypothetical protein